MKNIFQTCQFALFFALFALPTSHSHAKKTKAKHRIEVDATARIEVSPDVVDLTLTIRSHQSTPKAALSDLNNKTKGVIAALLKAGLPEKDLRISFLSIQPRYARRKHYDDPQQIEGYNAHKTLIACIRDPQKLGIFVTAAASADISEISTRFRSTKIVSNRANLRKMAMDAAWQKARQLAKSGKFPLGHVQSISEVNSRWGGSSHTNSFSYRRSASGRGIHPNAISLSLTLRVVFVTPHKKP